MVRCSVCGYEAPAPTTYCAGCGRKMAYAKLASVAPTGAPVSSPNPSVLPANTASFRSTSASRSRRGGMAALGTLAVAAVAATYIFGVVRPPLPGSSAFQEQAKQKPPAQAAAAVKASTARTSAAQSSTACTASQVPASLLSNITHELAYDPPTGTDQAAPNVKGCTQGGRLALTASLDISESDWCVIGQGAASAFDELTYLGYTSGVPMGLVTFVGYAKVDDGYGNAVRTQVITAGLPSKIASRINWSQITLGDLWRLATVNTTLSAMRSGLYAIDSCPQGFGNWYPNIIVQKRVEDDLAQMPQ